MKTVDLKTAERLHRLGFDGEYDKVWSELLTDEPMLLDGNETFGDKEIPAPRLDDAAYWLRDRYGVIVTLIPTEDAEENIMWMSLVSEHVKDGRHSRTTELEIQSHLEHDYETALEQALMDAIEVAELKGGKA